MNRERRRTCDAWLVLLLFIVWLDAAPYKEQPIHAQNYLHKTGFLAFSKYMLLSQMIMQK